MDERDIEYLTDHFSRSDIALVTGAGFSADARDARGRPLPSVQDLRDELWRLCFGPDPVEEDCSLGDVYQLALSRHRGALTALLEERLRVDRPSLPPQYEAWFAQPWKRVYTLNVDDLDRAAGEAFRLPRPIRTVSAVSDARLRPDPGGLDVIHLNGVLGDDPARLTFSWPQYGDRLSSLDRFYEDLVRCWTSRPLLFVGTKLDEPVLWQHLTLRQASRSPSYLVVPALSRPRQALLSEYDIRWVPMTAARFADEVLLRCIAPRIRRSARWARPQ